MPFQLHDNEARELASMQVRNEWDMLKAIAKRYEAAQMELATIDALANARGVKDFFQQLEWGIQGFRDRHQPTASEPGILS